LVWLPERKEVIKATNPIFIEDGDQQRMPEQPTISEPAELGRVQQGGAQQVEILPLDDESSAEDSSDEDENPNPVDRVTIQAPIREENGNKNDGQQKLGATTRAGQTVRLTEDMQLSKSQAAERKRKKETAA
jgi:hypothetical protein